MKKTTKNEILALVLGLGIVALVGVIIYHFTRRQENFVGAPTPALGKELTCKDLQAAFDANYNDIAQKVKNKLQPMIQQEFQKEMNDFRNQPDTQKYAGICKSIPCLEECGSNRSPSPVFSALQLLSN